MSATLTLKWWGYKHLDGSLHAKRYSAGDLKEASRSPFVEDTFGPFDALNRGDAMAILENHYGVAE